MRGKKLDMELMVKCDDFNGKKKTELFNLVRHKIVKREYDRGKLIRITREKMSKKLHYGGGKVTDVKMASQQILWILSRI